MDSLDPPSCASPGWTPATSAQWSASTARSLGRRWKRIRNHRQRPSVTSVKGLEAESRVDRALLKCEGSAGGELVTLLSGRRIGGRGALMALLPIFPVRISPA